MTLVQEAERAEKIRNAFIVFTVHCGDDHEAVQDINRSISELSSLSCALRHIDRLIELDAGPGFDFIHDNLKIVHEDVTWTLKDVWSSLGRLGRNYRVEDYQATWQEITEQAQEVSNGKKLHHVLDEYIRYLESLSKALESHATSPTLETLGPEIRGIHARRSPGPRPELSTSRPTTPTVSRSGSRRRSDAQKNLSVRPPGPSRGNSLKVQSPRSPEMRQPKSYERERRVSPDSSSISSFSDTTKLREKPYAPSPPLSPTVTSSTSRISSNTPSLETGPNHWAKSAFKNASSTPLLWSNEETRYHEVQGTKEHSYPNQAYESVFTLAYPEGLRVSLFCRLTDYRAKIVVLYRDRRGNSDFGCLPLTDLHLRREGSVLRICRRRSSGKPVTWVSLKFTTIERMVLFASTFIAMRSQDSSNHGLPAAVHDAELRDEVSEFSGPIVDSGFHHALRLYRDKITGAIRLQASVFKGELDRTPVWTAFITHYIMSPDWCRRINSRTIALADLKQHIFSGRYQPHLAPSGAFTLQFETRDDADAFLEVIDTLRMNVAGYMD